MKKRFDVKYTVSVDETLNYPRYSRIRNRYTNKALGHYNEILIGKNLKYKDAIKLIARFEIADGFFTIEYDGYCVLFGSRCNKSVVLTNNRDASLTYNYFIENESLYYPEIIL